jgi:hypothetical protein
LGLGKAGLGKLVNEVIHPAKSTVITQKMITELAHCVTYEPFETGEAAKKLTGEWIIYLRQVAKNYYLCCSTHDAGDEFILRSDNGARTTSARTSAFHVAGSKHQHRLLGLGWASFALEAPYSTLWAFPPLRKDL